MPLVTTDPAVIAVLPTLETPACLQTQPELLHSLKHSSSVLALAVSPQHDSIYAGTQDGEIVVWSLSTFHQVQQVQAHKRSVMSLSLSPDGSYLFSSACDPIINVWCPRSLRRLYEIYGNHDVGDIFSTAYSPQLDTLYIGAQNMTIQWVSLSDPSTKVTPESQRHPDRRSHRFFDSKAIGGTSTPRRSEDKWGLIPRANTVLEIDSGAIRKFAHYGYIYCMLIAKGPTVEVGPEDDVLISGGGDGTIKLWSLGAPGRSDPDDPERTGIREIMSLGADDAESVLSLALDGSFLYAGKLDGIVELWDLDTAQRLRVIKAQNHDIMSLQMGWGYLWTTSADGWANKFSTAHYGKYQHVSRNVAQKYQCLSQWKAHNGKEKSKILTSACTTYKNEQYYITGANDNDICVWNIKDEADPKPGSQSQTVDDVLLSALTEFVSYKTISSRPEFAEDCRKGATYLGALFKRMGGYVEMLSTGPSHNPVVLAKFSGKKESADKRKRILFYGHYDVVPADNEKSKWATDPFAVHGTNGYLYGRGISDNKGPILAALFAVTDLMQAQKLENDVIFVIEGEEEFGSRGFEQVIQRNKERIGPVDYILLANSYWLDDEVPCLTYGLRGVLHATICVDSSRPDTHSGVDGSHINDEPLSDLTTVLSRLKGRGNRVLIPGFYDGIPPVTPEEESRYDDIASILVRRSAEAVSEAEIKRSLLARWREPNLTIHRYNVSGPDGSLVSSHANSHISMRLVPGQEVDVVADALKSLLQREFAGLESENKLDIRIDNKAEPWLGDPTNDIFRTLCDAIVEAWPDCFEPCQDASKKSNPGNDGESKAPRQDSPELPTGKPKKPLYIREGGSIPAIRFLEKEFGAPAAHLPCGRASDSAHLNNERMSLINLVKAREIFGKVFVRL
ncbi:beta-ala-his dipeptidase [Trichoderma arundinaceum]|uniref:Beta-ala-his dipeptidase n=1 Tax=Trichoderma arundinaceum TaxID=490622 RepID=A0A395NYH5_TRIAR|nr:beta-ala-his dipeptidase [Trichoderma arundinaceum]